MTLWLIAYVEEKRGWCVITPRGDPVQGPYATHAEAVEALETMAFRIAQGWPP